MGREIPLNQARQLRNLLKAFEHAETVLEAAAGAESSLASIQKDIVTAQQELRKASLEANTAKEETAEAVKASAKRVKEIGLGLNNKVNTASELADTQLADIAERITQAVRGEEEFTKEIEERIRLLEKREAGVTATCNEAEDRLRRLQAELAKLG